MQEKIVESFVISRWKKKEPNMNTMKPNGRVNYGIFTKRFGILVDGVKVGGLKIRKKNYQKVTTGTYILESSKDSFTKQLLKKREYPFFTIKKEKRENFLISTLEIAPSNMKVMPNAVSVKHYNTNNIVDGSAYKKFDYKIATTIKPGVYISTKDLKKSFRTKVEFHIPKVPLFSKKIEQLKAFVSNFKHKEDNKKRKENHIKKLCLASSFATILTVGAAYTLMKEDINFSNKQEFILETTTKKESTKIEKNTSKLEAPIQIGSAITLKEDAAYYQNASMSMGKSLTYNDYVKETDYNEITAVAIVDSEGIVKFVSYDKGFEIFDAIKEAEKLGILNYQIMLHLGPIDSPVMEGVNPYCLGWTSILNMDDVTSKVYTKK